MDDRLGSNIKKRRDELGLSQEQLATLLDYKSRSTIAKIESGKNDLTQSKIEKIADALNTTPTYLMGWEDEQEGIEPFDDMNFAVYKVIGCISAGYAGEAIEEYTGEIEYLPYSMLRGRSPSDYFVLHVRGNSMYPQFLEGDKVLVHRVASVDSGSVAVVLYDGGSATLKRVNYIWGEDWLELIPTNPEYETKRIEGQDLENCKVLGRVVKLLRDV